MDESEAMEVMGKFKSRISRLPLLGMGLGVLVFIALYGYRILDPTFIGWTMEGDAAQHFLGWHFFRSQPWTFPLGAIHSYNYPEGTSLVYTDSIPLVAIPLKLLSPILPTFFQYHGLWLLLTYALQGFFSVLLLRRFTKNPLLIMLGTTFFLLSPVIVHRSLPHESLTAHWIILAALYLYLEADNRWNRIKWVLLLIMAAMVHFYLLVMALVIFAGYGLKELRENQWKKPKAFYGFFFLALAATAVVMWLVGYFIFNVRNTGSTAYGEYSMNLLSPFNASPIEKYVGDFVFLKPIPTATDGQLFEGFNYLGLGLILLLLVGVFQAARHDIRSKINKYLPLILVSFVFLAMSLSTKVTLADKVLLDINLPYGVRGGFGILRSSGRMFWPITYLLMLAAFAIIVQHNSVKRAAALLLVFIAIQIIDFSPWYLNIDYDEITWETPLVSEYWGQILMKSDRIVFVPPTDFDAAIVPFSLMAGTYGKTINVATTARDDDEARNEYTAALLQNISRGDVEGGTLYIIREEKYQIPPADSTEFIWGILDGFAIIAPKVDSIELQPWPG